MGRGADATCEADTWREFMRAAESWKETKFVRTRRGLRASSRSEHVGPGSWFVADRIARIYEDLLQRHVHGDLLDLGAGTVPLYGAYRDRATTVTCADWSMGPHDTSHIDVEADLNERLPFEDDSFDTIVCSDVLEHVRDPRLVMGQIARVLRPGGTLILGVPFFYWLHEQPHDYFRYTEYGLQMLVDEAGLSLVEMKRTGGSPEIAVDLVCKHLSKAGAVARLTGRVGGLLCRTPPVRALSRATEAHFPLGYVLVAERREG